MGFPVEKTFGFSNECALSVGNSPSGFATILITMKNTPFFGVGSIYSMSAIEIPSAEIYYNDKTDFLLDEEMKTDGANLTDNDRRLHKVSVYKVPELNKYRIDFIKLCKTRDPEIDKLDQWKDFSDMVGVDDEDRQLGLLKKYTSLLKDSKNEPDLILLGDIPEGYPELAPSVGIILFERME